MIFTGDPIDAMEAWRINLVNKVVPIESLMDEAMSPARKLCERPPLTLKLAKMCINDDELERSHERGHCESRQRRAEAIQLFATH